jgi:hypothetical protein
MELSFQTNVLGIFHESQYFTWHTYLTIAYDYRIFIVLERRKSDILTKTA